MSGKIEVYGDSISGNCYKIQLTCAQLGIEHVWRELDLMQGAARTDEFRAMNPNGKVPLLKLADGRYLPESNAIIYYLADGSALFSGDRYARANILSWMFFEQYSHEPYIATARFIVRYLGNPPGEQANLESKRPGGYKALKVMNNHLANNDFFANDSYSIADTALYAYTHVAEEGGFDLGKYTNIKTWFRRVESQAGFIPMKA
ncbi:MAG: glutathione S-transferase family protein [Proteobacteria bacterium]|nr:glutathione S-transferase family protein [Pseudomonadota bacterium]MDA1063102.1 glutathione S-transferase family protein [Pseudomonadota bacterium]